MLTSRRNFLSFLGIVPSLLAARPLVEAFSEVAPAFVSRQHVLISIIPLTFSRLVGTGEIATLSVRPQRPIQLDRIFAPAHLDFTFLDLSTSTALPSCIFSPSAFCPTLTLPTLFPGQSLEFTIQNHGAPTKSFGSIAGRVQS